MHLRTTILIISALLLASCQLASGEVTNTPLSDSATSLPSHTPRPTNTSTIEPTKTVMALDTASPEPTEVPHWVEPTQPPTVTVMPPLDITNPAVDTLRAQADARGFYIGAAVNNGLVQEADYAMVLASQFNLLTTENALKFGIIHPDPDRYNFNGADEIISFAQANGMKVRGHTLVWQRQMPEWLQYGEWTPEQVQEILYNHIQTVVGRYRGQIYAWDVVNEALTGRGSFGNTFWYQNLGPEYIDLAFQWAHEADPDALLFYNDYDAEALNAKSDGVYDLVKGMQERGIPIDGVGMQFHIRTGMDQNLDTVAQNIQRLADLGLQVHITELDVTVPDDPTEEDLGAQAETYRKVLDICLSEPNCTALVIWGFTDKYSWREVPKPGYGALIFDENFLPKPAYFAMLETISKVPR